MRETVTIQVGQCGNQIGNKFWSLLLQEHENTPDTDDALSAFFYFAPRRNGVRAMKARALLIDMECGVLNETMKSPLGSLFDETQYVMDVYGAGNNFAHGYAEYGPKYQENFLEGLRRVAETCESLQSFLVTHSLGGGTGSGVGSYMFSVLEDYYPRIYRYSTCVYPSTDSDVVTSPYNSILSTNELLLHADCVFPLHNSCLQSFAELENSYYKKHIQKISESRTSSYLPENTQEINKIIQEKNKYDKGFDDMNKIASRMLCHLTSSARFHGDMNVDLNEIYTNLIPYPNINFLSTSLSLQRIQTGNHIKNVRNQILLDSQSKNIQKSTTLSMANLSTSNNTSSSSSLSSSSSSSSTSRSAIQRSFSDILTKTGQLSAIDPIGTTTTTVTLASAFISRGSVNMSDLLYAVVNAQNMLRFPSWNPDACKIGMCSTPSPGETMSVMGIYNSTAFGEVLQRDRSRFLTLYKRKAMLHHYTEFMENDLIATADNNVAQLIQNYHDLEKGTYSYHAGSQHTSSVSQINEQKENGNSNNIDVKQFMSIF